MSGIEILVVVGGLFVGYWVVSRFISDKPAESESSRAGEQWPGQETPDSPSGSSRKWHAVLNVSPDATVDQIRGAYEALMSRYHPDKVAAIGDASRALAEREVRLIIDAYREAMQLRGIEP